MNAKVFIDASFSFWGVVFSLLHYNFSGSFAVTWGLLSTAYSRLNMISWIPSVFPIPLTACGSLISVWRRLLKAVAGARSLLPHTVTGSYVLIAVDMYSFLMWISKNSIFSFTYMY